MEALGEIGGRSEAHHIAYLRDAQVVGLGKQLGGHPEARGAQELVGRSAVSDLMREKKSVRLTFTAAAMSSTESFELEMLSMTYWFTCAMKRLPEGLAASPSMTR